MKPPSPPKYGYETGMEPLVFGGHETGNGTGNETEYETASQPLVTRALMFACICWGGTTFCYYYHCCYYHYDYHDYY